MAERSFDPAKHIRKVSGADYLEVKWRIAWLRDVAPEAVIDTDCISFNDTFAVFKCVATLPSGARATGWGSEERKDFKDYIEKAETKAIGRALALLGFGTQFADDFADADSGRIADAPVQRNTNTNTRKPASNPATVPADFEPQQFRDNVVAESQRRYEQTAPSWNAIYGPARTKGLLAPEVQALACKRYGLAKHSDMSADNMIDLAQYIEQTDADTLKQEAGA